MADGLGWLGGALGGVGSIIGAGINAGVQDKINKENMELQKEFAQNSIQWKVADAKKAGIHPAIGLGAQTYNATPSSVGADVGSGVAGAFKHFGSAIDSFIEDKSEERQLQLESLELDNEAKRQEIARLKASNNPNLFGGIGAKAYVPNPATQSFDTAGGKKIIGLSEDLMNYVEDKNLKDAALNNMILQEMDFHVHNLNQQALETSMKNGVPNNVYYIPATLDEMALIGMPYAKPATKKEWLEYIDRRKSDAKRDARIQRERNKEYKKWGNPNVSTNTTPFRPYRQPTDFDFSYRGK